MYLYSVQTCKSFEMPASPVPRNEHAKLDDEEIYDTVLDHNYSARPDHCRIQSAQPSQKLTPTYCNTSVCFPERSPNILNEGGGGGTEDATRRARLYQPLVYTANKEGDYASRKI